MAKYMIEVGKNVKTTFYVEAKDCDEANSLAHTFIPSWDYIDISRVKPLELKEENTDV